MPRRKSSPKPKQDFLHQPVALPVVVLTLLFIATLAASLVVARSHQSVLGTSDERAEAQIEAAEKEAKAKLEAEQRQQKELRQEELKQQKRQEAELRQQKESRQLEISKKLPEKPRELPEPTFKPMDSTQTPLPVIGKVKDQPKKLDLTSNEVEVKFEYEDNHLKLKAKTQDGLELELEEEALEDIQDRLSQDFTHIATTSGSQLLVINRGQNGAITELPISVDLSSNTLKVTTPQGTKAVTTLPDQAVQNLIANKVVTKIQEKAALPGDTSTEPLKQMLELKEHQGRLAYQVSGVSEQKLFGFIPVAIDKDIVISAETGEVLNQDVTLFDRFLDLLSL